MLINQLATCAPKEIWCGRILYVQVVLIPVQELHTGDEGVLKIGGGHILRTSRQQASLMSSG